MNPLFKESGLTPTAALAMRANAQAAAFSAKEAMKAKREELGMADGFELAKAIRPAPAKLGAGGEPAPVVRKWPR